MEFKKINDKSIQIKTKTSNLKIMVEANENGAFEVKTVEDDKVMSFERPGEYGVQGIHFVMLEENVEKFEGKPTVLSIADISFLNAMVLSNKFDLSKKAIDKMPDLDIIVAPYTNDSKLKSLVKKLQPSFLVLVKDFLGYKEDEKVKAGLQSDFNIAQEGDTKVKLEETDISTEDDVATQVYILN